MTEMARRGQGRVEPLDIFETFDRMLDEWTRNLPFRQARPAAESLLPEMIRVDEYRENGNIVVRAELPGVDPERDVEVSVAEGMLQIEADRRIEEDVEEKNYVRHELRHGHLSRRVPLPEGVSGNDITASYQDGILEIRIPAPQREPQKKIPVRKG
ncbi:Hsp20/alpha crystallin family protein [Goodfellowiella coeruleoviolacea]|uniref:HSP20 family protein n=1 Tax=Goodfellowiella coeruleoviolacea TaxID=334858 RepID=A0AAE3KCW7_9PSEU|nr:Hsp20/alpha crystallin family protein [Goodfellowiella coeruleoviolacea]MCP2163356.1 HSP20 family protein [Goodfellowiella coeruleoviolacea]